jgi:tetratricopeptide (TPR) repeat protein
VAICRRLDGLPLALELAAARVNVLSLPSLSARLDKGLNILSAGRRDATDRQRTLRGAIAWSYELLTGEEQKLFRRLGVFAGGCSFEAAEYVCDSDDLDVDILDGLASLVDKNLVRTNPARPDRFSMLETIREFALEQLELEAGDTIVRENLLNWLVEQTKPTELVTKEWLELIGSEIDNIRAGLEIAAQQNSRALCEIAVNVTPYWHLRGPLAEGRVWLETGLAQCDGSWTDLRARTYWAHAFITSWLGDYAASSPSFGEALSLSREIADGVLEARTLGGLGALAQAQGDLSAAQDWLERSRVRAREVHHPPIEAAALGDLGVLAALNGDLVTAHERYEAALRIQEEIGDILGASVSLYNLGEVAEALGETHEATLLWRRCFENNLVILKDRYRAAATLRSFALMQSPRDPECAAVALGAAKAVIELVGSFEPDWLIPPRLARLRDECEAKLGKERYEELQMTGAAMSLEEAAHYVGLVQ